MPITNPHLVTSPIASTTGTLTAAQQIALETTNLTGLLTGVAEIQTALARFDGTGIGASITNFTNDFTAATANIDDWFGGRQLNRLRCTNISGSQSATFTLPETTDLTTAFDQLVTAGLPERLAYVIELLTDNANDTLSIVPAAPPNPQIGSTSSILVRNGVAASVEITRTSGTISDYVWTAIGLLGNTGNVSADSIKLINPSTAVWDASASGPLPSNGVVKGNAYRVVNAPTDGTGRFNEVMLTDDWVVWSGETFTSWSAEPHQWFVIPAHEVRRITALEDDFLSMVQRAPTTDRNTVTRGTNYADSAGEIRMKIYATRGDYSAADLNTTGDIDEYTDPSTQSGFLGIRLTGTNATLASTLPTLYVYAEDGSGNFTRLANLDADFTFEGNFGGESDYLSREALDYTANDTWRIYFGTFVERFINPDLDIEESNLSDAVRAKLNRTDGGGSADEQRLAALESKVSALFPLTPDVDDLTAWAGIFVPEAAAQTVNITDGYSLIADYRGPSTRYESAGITYDDTGVDVVDYTGLGDNLYRTFGFKVNALAQVDEITLTGTSGTANINVDSTNYLATFNTDLTTTASDFVTTHAAALTTAGITVTSNAAVLTFTADVGGTAFTIAAPANATGDLGGTLDSITSEQVLMWIVDGSEVIPFVDMTASGNFRINHYTPATTEDQVITDRPFFLTRSGDTILTSDGGTTSTYTVSAFPASADHQSRFLQIETDVLVNGTDTGAGHFLDITVPADNTDQDEQTVQSTVNLGPLHGNRSVTVTVGYALRISGSDQLIDFRLLAAPSDVTIRLDNVVAYLSYTAPSAVARVDDFQAFNDGLGAYTFTGENELLVTFQPSTLNNSMDAVAGAITAAGAVTLMNDITVPEPQNSFEAVRIPDTTAISGFEFRTFSPVHFLIHRDLGNLLPRRATQWCYGLALLQAITERVINQPIDFTQGLVLTAPDNGRWLLTVDNTGTLKTEVAP